MGYLKAYMSPQKNVAVLMTSCVKRSVIHTHGRGAKVRNKATVTWFVFIYNVARAGQSFYGKIQVL